MANIDFAAHDVKMKEKGGGTMYHRQRKLPLIVKKSNDLVRTQLIIENNALANRIFATLIRHMDENFFPNVSFPVSELIDEESKGGDRYKRLETAARVLMRAIIDSVIVDETGKKTGFCMDALFIKCKYDKGFITAEFNPNLKPHFLGLKKHFTELNYFDLIELSSFYSQRIYELLKSWEKPNGFAEIKLNALYDLVSFPASMQSNFAEAKRRLLGQAEKEINEKTDLKFRWEAIKEGRKVVAIRFIIGERGLVTQKKRQNKEAVQKRRENHDEAARRKPHLAAASKCRAENNIKSGDICKLAKPRTLKCKWCNKGADVAFYDERLF